MQIKVTLDQEIYEYLKTNSQQNRRTLSAELNTILEQYIKSNTTQSLTNNISNISPEPTYKTNNKKSVIGNEIDEEELINDPYYDPNF